MSDALNVLSSLRGGADDGLAPLFYLLEDQWDKKLWHQLTQTLFDLFKDPRSVSLRISLFDRFVVKLQQNLNPLAFASFAASASEQCVTTEESLKFMQNVAAKFDKSETKEVLIFCQLNISSLHIKLNDVFAAKKLLDVARSAVEDQVISDKAVLAQFYGVSCEFFKYQAEYTNYYRNALLYLACIDKDLGHLELVVLQQRAYDLCIAALLASKIFDFGELILHPVLKSLDGSEYQWLFDLVAAVNAGDVPRFQQLRTVFLDVSPVLKNALPFLEQKICLMALCECVFRRQSTDRNITFSAVAKETHLQAGAKVEVLVMKAFSLGLMSGSIDEVSKTISISWLQPRALSREQMGTMRQRLGQWDFDVRKLGDFINGHGENVWQAV